MKIMAALDLSEYADFVLTKAIKTAKQQQAKLDIFIVVERVGNADVEDKLFQQANKAAERYRQKAIVHGLKAKKRVRYGFSAADEIIKYQQQENLDLIVIGRKDASRQNDGPIGSVTQKVAAHATSTVMIVRCMADRDKKIAR